jgi:hypothetical protein
MSGATTELNLATAVDSDDNADYLTLSLANSLRTVDGLFNNITGHTHGGAHQGAPVVPAAGSITSAMIADGTIATADLANASVTNAKLASDTARANLLTNGGFEVWQRGNGPYSSNAFTADRWAIGLGAVGLSVSADSVNVDAGSQRAAAITATGSGAASSFFQTLKTSDESLAGRVVSFSVRVRTTTAGVVSAGIGGDVTGATSSGSHTGGGVWQTLTATVTVNTNATQVLLVVSFSAACTAYVDNAMLVVGSVPADYAPLHPADDLARCLRYYETLVGNAYQTISHNMSTTQCHAIWPFKAAKAITPTITVQNVTSINQLAPAGGSLIPWTAATPQACTTNVADIAGTVASGLVAASASMVLMGTSGQFSAEANP